MTIQDFLKLRIADLSRITGELPSSWSRWLKGERSINSRALLRSARKLEMSAEDLADAIAKHSDKRSVL